MSDAPLQQMLEGLTRLGLPRRYLLYVGTIEPRKNLLPLLRAYADLPALLRERWPLVLAGRWGWNARDVADYLHDACLLDIVDVTRSPDRADDARILATPTLIRLTPKPERRVTGDLADAERVLAALDLTDDSRGR